MELIGYVASLLIGISLGLIGGGGSILTVPVLVYLFGVEPILATTYSLFVVGSTSLIGAANNFRQGQVHLKIALLFGLSSIATVLMVRRLLLPLLPDILYDFGSWQLTKSGATMILFASLMLLASYSMIRSQAPSASDEAAGTPGFRSFIRLLVYGVLIGLVTGLLGAGGGFLLIPALVFLVRLPMKQAIGTSLCIISMNSLIGFLGDWSSMQLEWSLLIPVAALAITGILIGGRLGRHVNGAGLKKGFGWFVLAMGVFVLVKELLK
jgi:uncharacterized membrane protein YfcA